MMPKPIKQKADNHGQKALTPREVADEVELVRCDLRLLADRLEKLSWALMTAGVKPGRVQETSDDIPF